MGEWIELTAADGFVLSGWREAPSSPAKGGIVVIQEIFGVNAHIRSICARLAAEGYLAIAPALFDRQQRGFESGYSPEEVGIARGFIGGFDMAKAKMDIAAARDAATAAGGVGIVGFCLGGSLAYAAALDGGWAAAVGFYGGMIAKMADQKPRIPVMLHFGKDDQSIPLADVEAIMAKRPEVPTYIYPAGHGFNCDARSAYEPQSAALAWSRTLDFLAEKF